MRESRVVDRNEVVLAVTLGRRVRVYMSALP